MAYMRTDSHTHVAHTQAHTSTQTHACTHAVRPCTHDAQARALHTMLNGWGRVLLSWTCVSSLSVRTQ
eukprot:15458423-Alexandrium_andersonii.AAC.1